MTATLEQIGELRSDVRHIQAAVDRMLLKQDELMDRFGEHLSDDTKAFAAVDKKIEVAAAEKRGQGRAARMVYAAGVTALSFLAAAFGGGHVKFPGH